MISAVEWIPKGVANSTPTKYEWSRAEQMFLERVKNGALNGREEDGDAAEDAAENNVDDDVWEDMEEEEEVGVEEAGTDQSSSRKSNKVVVPKVDINSLPSDLRMDDYGDDDEDEEDGGEIGKLLVGKDEEMMTTRIGNDGPPLPDVDEPNNNAGADHDDSDSEDEDDLGDIPDTREYMPLDMDGLNSLNFGGGTNNMKSGKVIMGDDGEGYTMEDLQNMTFQDIQDLDGDEEEEDDAEEEEDVKIRDGDALIVVAKTEDDFASLEINIYDTESSNLYIHHDIPLPSFPLCLALGNVVSTYQPNAESSVVTGNYCAVGSFETGIEIWNLDVMNALEPTMVLGGMDTRCAEDDWIRMHSSSMVGQGNNKKKKKKNKKGAAAMGLREGSHTDAVMGLSWNAVHRQVLASGSADGTVKLWDVTNATGGPNGDYVRPSATLTHHTDKVQSLAWHPTEGTLLATGGYDRRLCLVDARTAAASATASSASVKKAKLPADCEAIAWDPHNQQYLTAASEDGVVQCWDVRKFDGEPVWSMIAHEYGGVSDISYNPQVPGMLVTCSIDKTVALWDTQNVSPNPQPCGSKDMNVGKLYSVSCYPSSPWLLSCGGSGNALALWDMEGEDAIQNRFGSRVFGRDGGVVSTKEEPDFEAIMGLGDNAATIKALDGMNKSKKKKKTKGKNKKVHRKTN